MPRLHKTMSSLSSSSFAIHGVGRQGSDASTQAAPKEATAGRTAEVLTQVEFLRLTGLFNLRTRIRGSTEMTEAFFDLVREGAAPELSCVLYSPGEGLLSPSRGRSPSPDRTLKEELAREAWLLGGLKLKTLTGGTGLAALMEDLEELTMGRWILKPPPH